MHKGGHNTGVHVDIPTPIREIVPLLATGLALPFVGLVFRSAFGGVQTTAVLVGLAISVFSDLIAWAFFLFSASVLRYWGGEDAAFFGLVGGYAIGWLIMGDLRQDVAQFISSNLHKRFGLDVLVVSALLSFALNFQTRSRRRTRKARVLEEEDNERRRVAKFGARPALQDWLHALENEAGAELADEPGMEFGALRAWWGKRAPRPRPHEGIDLVRFKYPRHTAGPDMVVRGRYLRVIEAGEVLSVFPDFLGKTAVVRRGASTPLGVKPQFWVYAHLVLMRAVKPGAQLAEGDTVGRVERGASVHLLNDGAPLAHLHLSLLEAAMVSGDENSPWNVAAGEGDWGLLNWSNIHHASNLRFMPLAVRPP